MQGHALDTLTWMHWSKKSILTVLDCGGDGDIFSKLQSKPGCIVECMYPGMYLKDSLIEQPKSTLCVSNLKQPGDQFKRWNVNQTICIDPEMLTLAQLLERDVLRGSSKVDFAERRGVGNGGCYFPFFLTRYLRLLVFCTRCHLGVNLSTLSKNLKFNNLEKAKFHLIFAPIGFRNLWIRHNVLLWTPFSIKNVLGQRMPSKKLVCHRFLKFWMYWSRLLFNLLRRKKKCYSNIWINCLKILMSLAPEQSSSEHLVYQKEIVFGWKWQFCWLDKESAWKGQRENLLLGKAIRKCVDSELSWSL